MQGPGAAGVGFPLGLLELEQVAWIVPGAVRPRGWDNVLQRLFDETERTSHVACMPGGFLDPPALEDLVAAIDRAP